MYHNFDDDSWEQLTKKEAGKRGNKDVLLIALFSVFFLLLVAGGAVYYSYYTKAQTLKTEQGKSADAALATPASTALTEETTAEEVDSEYAAITADMTEEEKEAYDTYLTFLERYEATETSYPIILKSYKEPVVHANTVVFLLSFDNRPILTDADFWSQYFFGDSGYYGTGSVRQYFKEVSHGTIAVQPVKETQGTKNDGIIRLNMNMNHPEFTNRFYSSSDNAMVMDTIYSMIKKVLIQADDYIDYADYDANGDGVVESKELDIILIFAGYEDAYVNGAIPNTTYSAQVRFYERSIQLDSVAMSQAIMTAELSPIIDAEIPVNTMGAICHEMGHGMGLPDLYDTDYSSEGLAFHSLMAGGSYNYYDGEIGSLPPPLMAWSLVELGALEPEEVTSDGIFYLWRRSSENYNVIKIPTQDGYYLIENVDFEGYGQGLSLYVEEPGVAIWYIDENVLDSLYATARFAVNDDELIPGVRLVEPNGGRDMLSGDFDYMRVYDHYFRLSGDNKYVGSHGVIFNILDDPGEVMRVEVTIVD